MMRDYPRWFLLACTALVMSSIRAQQIFIPDVELRAVYNTWVPGSVDVDGYLDASLQGVQEFDSEVTIDYSDFVTQVNGLEAFLALRVLYLNSSVITALESLPPALDSLSVGEVAFAVWPSMPNSLRYLSLNYLGVESYPPPDISNTQIESFELQFLPWDQDLVTFVLPSTLSYLGLFQCEGVTALPELPDGLDSLFLNSCFYLTDLPTLPNSLRTMSVGECSLAGELVLPNALEELYCSSVGITAIASFPSTLRRLVLDMCPVNCLPVLPDSLEYLDVILTEVQCLPNAPPDCYMTYYTENLGLCSVLNSTCQASNPAMTGQVFRDLNNDGVQDGEEPGCGYAEVVIDPIGLAGGVGSDGHFDFGLPVGEYMISCVPSQAFIQSVVPTSHVVSLPDVTSVDTDNYFALVMPDIVDHSVSITTLPSRPGFESVIWLAATNQGTLVADVPLQINLDADQTFVSSTPPPDTQNGNSLMWDMGGLLLGEQRVVSVTVHTDASIPVNTPITHIATVSAVPDDVNTGNNTVVTDDVVVGSFDPNDKTVSPTVIEASELATAELTYTIRFQNTGTYQAERVIITDTLSTSLDWTSFRFVASSHTCNWTLYNGVLRFTFEPIYLPDSTSDESNSHGFVTFSMKPDVTAGLGPIGNVANIYFDYNAPVITNEAVVDISTGTPMHERTGARLFPIPAQELLWIQRISSGTALASVIDAQGRTLLTRVVNGTTARLELGELPPGAYVLELRSDSIERIPFLKQ